MAAYPRQSPRISRRLAVSIMFFLLSCSAAPAQYLVHDPTSMAASIANNANEVQSLVDNTQRTMDNLAKVTKLLSLSQKTYERLSKVSEFISNAQEIAECIGMAEDAVNLLSQAQEQLLNDNYLDVVSKAMYLESCVNATLDVTAKVADIVERYGSAGSTSSGSMDDYSRMQLLMDDKNEVEKSLNVLRYEMSRSELAARQARVKQQIVSAYMYY